MAVRRFHPLRFERKGETLATWPHFARRMALSLLITLAIVTVALLVGILGYHGIARLSWIDSLLNAAMILTGMGPVDPMKDAPSKLFASAYALFSGVVFLSGVSVVLSPVIHRVIHTFHLAEDSK
jgi:hypothetical protein